MGRKQNAAEQKPKEEEKPKEEPKEEEKPEEPAIVKSLKEVDDKYLALQREFDKEVQKLAKQYTEKQAPLLEERKKMLTENAKEASESGTPALPRFWLEALKNHPAFEEGEIEKHDEPVLEYLIDITTTDLVADDAQKGYKLTFTFAENPYFTNSELTKEFHTEAPNPYTGEPDIKEVKSTTIDWKPGKDVTVERTAKKVKGGGAKKAKQKGKETIEPRESFFSAMTGFFKSYKKGDPLPDGLNPMMDDESDDGNEEEMGEMMLEQEKDVGDAVREQVIPYAVRWFTGEACPRDDDDDDEDEEEESDDDDDEDDDESDEDDEPAPKKKGAAKKSPKSSPGNKPAKDPKDPKAEECKQQ